MTWEQVSRECDEIAERTALEAATYGDQARYDGLLWGLRDRRFACRRKVLLSRSTVLATANSVGALFRRLPPGFDGGSFLHGREFSRARTPARLSRRRGGQEWRRTQTRRLEQRRVEQRFASAQPGFETREIPIRHCPQCHEGTQIVIRWRDELAAGRRELIDQHLGLRAARRIVAP